MGVEPFFDLEFPKWDLALVGESVPGKTPFLELLVLALVSLSVSALLLWLVRLVLRSRAFPFFRLPAPSLEHADAELACAHAQYLFVWRALDRKDFSANLRELLRQADQRVAAQELALSRASNRVDLSQLNRMRLSVSRVREALARKATRYCERLVGAAFLLPEALDLLRTADPRRLSRGVALRAMVIVAACLLCVDRGATVSPLLDNPVVAVLWGPRCSSPEASSWGAPCWTARREPRSPCCQS